MTEVGWILAAAAASTCLLVGGRVAAQGVPELDARVHGKALYDAGVRLMGEGKLTDACPKFESALKADPGKIGVMLKLAGCYEAAGRVASAKTAYDLAESEANRVGDARAADARTRSAELAPRVPTLTIVVAASQRRLAGLTVQRDGRAVEAELWGVPVPVDPGKHTITASGPGRTAFRGVVTLAEGETRPAEVPELPPFSAPASIPPTLQGPLDPIASPPKAAQGAGGIPRWVWQVGGAGLGSTTVGAIFLGLAIDGQAKINLGTCGACTPQVAQTKAYQVVAGVFGGAGIVALGASIVGIARAPSAKPHALRLLPMTVGNGAGASLEGSFGW